MAQGLLPKAQWVPVLFIPPQDISVFYEKG